MHSIGVCCLRCAGKTKPHVEGNSSPIWHFLSCYDKDWLSVCFPVYFLASLTEINSVLLFKRVSIAVINTMSQKEERVYFHLQFCITILLWGKSEQKELKQNLGTGAGKEAVEVCNLLDCSPCLVQPGFIYHPGPPSARIVTAHRAGPSHANH